MAVDQNQLKKNLIEGHLRNTYLCVKEDNHGQHMPRARGGNLRKNRGKRAKNKYTSSSVS